MVHYKDIPELPPDWSRPLTSGAIEVGNWIATLLLGIVIAQVYTYYRSFPGDPRYIRISVGVAFAVDLVLSGLHQRFVWHYTIETPFAGIQQIDPSLSVGIPLLGILACIVQTLYCLRLWRVIGNAWIALGCWSLALTRFAMFLYITYISASADKLLDAITSQQFQRALLACLASGVAADVAVCATMTIGLIKRRTGFAHTDKLVDRVITYTVGSGLLPMIVAIAEFVTYCLMRDKFVWMACYFINSQALMTALLVTLNQRTASRTSELTLSQSTGSTLNGQRYTFDKVHPQVSGIVMELSTVTHADPVDMHYYRRNHLDKRDEFVNDAEKGVSRSHGLAL